MAYNCEFSQWYDKMMHSVDYDKWADYVGELLNKHNCNSVLECGCGTGNLTLRLVKKGFSVIASDLSESMLMETRNKMMKAGFRFPIIQQDMQDMNVHRPVDAVIAVCDAVNYLLDTPERFFASAFRILKPGGVLLFDISSEYKLSHVLRDSSFSDTSDDWAYICDNSYDPELKQLRMDLTAFVREGSFFKRFEEQHIQRAYNENELEEMLQKAGYCNISIYDCFTVNAPNDNSERIQFVAEKPLDHQEAL